MNSRSNLPILVDLALSARLERVEGLANSRFVEARKRVNSESRAEWMAVAGAFAMFDGVDSPCTQTFGLGVGGPVSLSDLEKIEAFFQSRSATVYHEVSPLVDGTLIQLLNDRRYQPMEFTNVMCRRIGNGEELPVPSNPKLQVRVIQENEHDAWAKTSSMGWSEYPELAEFIMDLGRNYAATEGAIAMQAEENGNPIATGVVLLVEGVALLAGASTVPEARKRGAQSALLAARLELAVQKGCDMAMMCALAGSPSQRNAQRNGFQIAYTRIKWKKVD